MKVRKRLWGAVLLLCALLCMATVIVSADDDGIHTHPVCGATHTDIGDHTEECADVVWTAWNGTDDIDYDECNTAYVYLTDNATRSNGLTVTGGTLNLCLNGKTLNTGITVEGDGTLDICDCRSGGAITRDSGCVIYVETVNESNVHTTLNLYGGKITGSSNNFSSGMIELYNNDYGNAQTVAVFNMYGGEVINGGSGAAVYANYANVGSAYYSLNIYGGNIHSEKADGFHFDNNKNITIQIAGGTITSSGYGVKLCSGNTLILSGNPTFTVKESYDGAGIYLPKDTSFIVKDDFTGTASVMQGLGETVKGVIAKPASGNSLSTKMQYFTSAEAGYFVECNEDGHLRLTACAITEQPTADNRYTVAANGNPYYQWYRAKRGNVSLTSENATAGDFSYSSGWGGEWYYFGMKYDATPVTLKVFTLYMTAGDVLTLKKENEGGDFFITDITFTHSDGSEVTATQETYDDYTYTAPKDGEYTLEITAGCMEMEDSDSYVLNLSFTATVSADVADDILSGQTDKTLDTAALISGKYICAVTWEGKTTLYSNAVEFVHSHTWNDGEVTTEPTCTATGVKTFTCTVCSETKTETMPALGHTWVDATCTKPKTCSVCSETEGKALGHSWNNGEVTTAPTCTATGVKTFTCTVCSETKTETMNALGHSWKDATCTTPKTCSVCDATEGEALGHTWVDATCTKPKTCSVCNATEGEALGHSWKDATCTKPKTCSVCDATEGKALGHSWNNGEVTTEPTCTATGVKTFTCTVCSETKTETMNALGHTWTAPTCTTPKTCSVCNATDGEALGHSWVEATCTKPKTCSVCNATEGKAPGHSWNDGEVTAKPTCTATGVKTFTCTACSETKTETMPALGHSWVEATCTKPRTCSVCDATEGKAPGHSWNDGKVTTKPTCTATGVKTFTCTVCSETKTETMNALGHSWVAPTCTKPKTCSVCNATEGEALGHSWAEATCTKPKTCSVCNATDGEALGHSWKDATCTKPKTCSVCNATEGEALGHSWEDATCTKPKTCSVCDATEGEALGHSWEDATCTKPKTCSVCNATEGEALGHTWVDATCTKPKTCSVCNATEGEALGHSWKDATCTKPKTCSVCNATEGKALGHDFTGSTWQSDADRHWKKCSRCEVIAEEAAHAGGTATCKDKAVCATCAKAYGVSNPDNHTGGTEIRDMVKATAEKTGHTGNCYCKGCHAKLSDGTVIPVTSDLSTDKKDGLTAALEDMGTFLSEQGDVYTDEQKQQLADSMEVIKSALKSIENAEEAVKKAEAMPAADKTRPDDKAAIDAYEAAKKAYDALSADEKKMAGERTKSALDAMLKALTAYDVTYGNGSTWKKNESDNGLTFTVNGYHKKFAGITINGEVVDEHHYDIETGSTVITLKAEYLQTLPAGTYTLLVRYTDGSTDGEDTFTITQNVPSDPSDPSPAKTADNGVMFVWIGVVIFCLIVVIALVWFFKKQKQ